MAATLRIGPHMVSAPCSVARVCHDCYCVIPSAAKNLLWTNALFFTFRSLPYARDSSLRCAPFENDGQKI
ncbi:MAG: hypothetical protein ACI35M_05000, partial [Alistipes sp.]